MAGVKKMAVIALLLTGGFVFGQQSVEQTMQTGRKLKEAGKCEEAIAYFTKALQTSNDHAEALYECGWCYNELKEFGKAAETLKKANAIRKNNPDILYELGYAYYNLDSADISMSLYQRVLAIDTAHLQTMIGIGDIYRDKQSRIHEALNWYLKVLAKDAKNIKAGYWSGWCYNDLKDYSKAITHLRKVVQQDSLNYPALNELGFSYFSLQRYNEAINTLLEAESSASKSETAIYYLGLCFVNTGKKQEAVKRYNALVLMNSKLAAGLLTEIRKMQ